MFSKLNINFRYILFLSFILFTTSCADDETKEEIEPQEEEVPLKIMPLGNSITQGGEVNPSYRYELWKMLVDAGVKFEFVGSMDTNWFREAPNTEQGADVASPVIGEVYKEQTFTNKHEGHWGWTTTDLLNGYENPTPYKRDKGKLSDWLKGYTPDVVLMHLGTNDMIHSKTTSGTVSRIEQIIGQLRADNENVAILLAKITPIPSTYANVDSTQHFVSLLPALATRLSTQKSPIIVVDINTGYNPATLTYDSLHPNTAGEKFIAKRWYDAIRANEETLHNLAAQRHRKESGK
ncbi:SGNH/GDSL hydrolase family protein [Pontibacter virosus]|uniref:GDSL-like lipase/acylhydrolase family protein n=1 Tax=Pontibacter virosus TaxID=1765052 RepID=A0A2U1ANT0_9BACT|nr:SGNH/GDSL hydrolase family protein [Pontibacter virosus]PVY38083.1 GDSL-like lipase/acylhydrolase family protein [Pontibacter virosus]